MPVFLTPPQTCSLLTASRRGDVESLKSEVDILAETFGVIKGEILLSAEDNHGNTVLHASSELGLTKILAWTLQEANFPYQPGLRSTFIEQRNHLGDTAVNTSAITVRCEPRWWARWRDFLIALLSNRAYPTTHNGFGFTALHYAAQYNHQDLVAILLANKASPAAASLSGDTPLHVATRNQHLGITTLLLQHGAPANTCNASGAAPLHIAVAMANWPLAKELMDNGAPKDQHNAVDGDTPLHVAVRVENVDMVERLLQCGAGVQERNRNGLTPFEVATLTQSEEVRAAFLNFGRW